MSSKCKHSHISFIGVLHYRDYPEKCFKCSSCNMIITDYVTQDEMAYFKENNDIPFNL